MTYTQHVTSAEPLRHYPGCEWICGSSGKPERYECRCAEPRFRKHKGKPGRTCQHCQGYEDAS